ncbi:carboxypeptidase regulatory-like domain-containing protein [Candidatus Bathyarchaeota archaeon]|nr:carboxypeptidase regulatory-like domain-containing protein [Candidatus Bathyarchaeota archaeon]
MAEDQGANMRGKILPIILLVFTIYLVTFYPAYTVAYKGFGYSGVPIKYGGWLIGQVTMQIRHNIQLIPWAKITVTSTDGTFSEVTYTNGYGCYRIYLPPGEYKVTVEHARYSQTYEVTMREDAIYRLLNVYLERPDAEFQDRLSSGR